MWYSDRACINLHGFLLARYVYRFRGGSSHRKNELNSAKKTQDRGWNWGGGITRSLGQVTLGPLQKKKTREKQRAYLPWAKKGFYRFFALTSLFLRTSSSSSLATHIRTRSVLSTTKIIAWTSLLRFNKRLKKKRKGATKTEKEDFNLISLFRVPGSLCIIDYLYIYIFFPHTSTFQVLDKPRSQKCRPFSPPVLAFNFYRA